MPICLLFHFLSVQYVVSYNYPFYFHACIHSILFFAWFGVVGVLEIDIMIK